MNKDINNLSDLAVVTPQTVLVTKDTNGDFADVTVAQVFAAANGYTEYNLIFGNGEALIESNNTGHDFSFVLAENGDFMIDSSIPITIGNKLDIIINSHHGADGEHYIKLSSALDASPFWVSNGSKAVFVNDSNDLSSYLNTSKVSITYRIYQ